MTLKPWNTHAERTAYLMDLILMEASFRITANYPDFRDRAVKNIRADLRDAGVNSFAIWWLMKFVVPGLVRRFFFSAEADLMRSGHGRTEASVRIFEGARQ